MWLVDSLLDSTVQKHSYIKKKKRVTSSYFIILCLCSFSTFILGVFPSLFILKPSAKYGSLQEGRVGKDSWTLGIMVTLLSLVFFHTFIHLHYSLLGIRDAKTNPVLAIELTVNPSANNPDYPFLPINWTICPPH